MWMVCVLSAGKNVNEKKIVLGVEKVTFISVQNIKSFSMRVPAPTIKQLHKFANRTDLYAKAGKIFMYLHVQIPTCISINIV